MATAETSSSAAPTVKFAIGTYVVLKILSGIGDKIAEAGKARFKKHAAKLGKKAKKRFSRRTMMIAGGVAVLGGIGYYVYRQRQAAAAAAAAAAAKAASDAAVAAQGPSADDMIASSMPGFDISLF